MTPARQLVVLCGSARCGKSTVAEMLAAEFQAQERRPSTILPLGGLVKAELAELTGVPRATQEEDRPRWRRVWQVYATEVRRAVHGSDYWINLWQVAAEPFASHLIVPDARFKSELGGLSHFASRTNRVIRLVYVRRSRWWEWTHRVQPWRWHASEWEWRSLARQFPYRIVNNGTLADLRRRVEELVASWI